LHVDQSARDAKDGLAYEFIQAGAKKSDGSSHKPLTDSARADITGVVNSLYDLFVGQVARHTGLAEAAVRATEAGTFFGLDAVAQRLAHRLGTLDDAVAEAARRAESQVSPTARGALPRASLEHSMSTQESAAPADPAATAAATGAAPQEGAAAQQGQSAPQGQAAAAAGAAAPGVTLSAEDCAGIVELCTMAGQPGKAADFIRAGASRGEVSEALLRARANGTQLQGETIRTAHAVTEGPQQRSNDPSDPHGWGASAERVFGKQGA
jgi:hypothetical protein